MPLRAGPIPLVVMLSAQSMRRKGLHDGLSGSWGERTGQQNRPVCERILQLWALWDLQLGA